MKAQVVVTSCGRRGLEVEQIRSVLGRNGYAVSPDDWVVDRDADLILLSTCGFTQAAEDFGFETLRRIRREKKPSARVVLGGCIPEIDPERVKREYGGPTFGPRSYERLEAILGLRHGFGEVERPNVFPARPATSTVRRDLAKGWELLKTFDGSLPGLADLGSRLGNAVRRRLIRTDANLVDNATWYIQIQEGCSMKCSYCSICKAIGELSSKPADRIMREFQRGYAMGFRSFQLMGDNAGSYGLDRGSSLAELLSRFHAAEGDFTLDLTDIAPVYLHLIYKEVLALLERNRLARLYIPIQSGSRRILALMRRDCDMDRVKRMLESIRRSGSRLTLGTSVIVGFPSETEEELEQTIDFCRAVEFDWIWCHSYSARPETGAAKLSGQWDAATILQRARKVRAAVGNRTRVSTADDSKGSRTCQG